MRTSSQILEAFANAIARTPSLYWMVPIPPAPYRRQRDPRKDEQR
jgi:hypothetical protein